MNIYEITYIEQEIENIAAQNEGEIPEEKIKELVEAQVKSIVQIEKLCKYIKHLDYFQETCAEEINRITKLMKSAGERTASIKKYMTPLVEEKGRFDAGTFQLTTRKTKRTIVDDDFSDPEFIVEIPAKTRPDKEKIKKALLNGEIVDGAELEEVTHLKIK